MTQKQQLAVRKYQRNKTIPLSAEFIMRRGVFVGVCSEVRAGKNSHNAAPKLVKSYFL